MPLPNGVDPTGTIHEICRSAAWLGNRGILHDSSGLIFRKWKTKTWVICTLHYRTRSRKPLMQPKRYSELFFLDEATALAAGHRPCAECQRDRYNEFKAAWMRGMGSDESGVYLLAAALDKSLHAARIDRAGAAVTFVAALATLPDGAMFIHDGHPRLKRKNDCLGWSDIGYSPIPKTLNGNANVTVLTPKPTVDAMRAGYRAQTHSSAN